VRCKKKQLHKKRVEGVLKVLFAPFVIAGLDSERSRTMTRNPLINSIIFLGGSGFRRNDAWLLPE